MATMADPHKRLSQAASAILFVGGLSLVIGLIAVLFDVRLLQGMGLGWSSILFGGVFFALSHYVRKASMVALIAAISLYSIDAIVFLSTVMKTQGSAVAGGVGFRAIMIWLMARGIGAIREMSKPVITSSAMERISPGSPRNIPAERPRTVAPPLQAGPKPVSFVAGPSQSVPSEIVRPELLSKSLTPEILNLRFVAYRCEIASDHFKAIYQNASQKELKWFEVTTLVIRQLPFQAPWEGKLILDIVPAVIAGERIQPVRILSSTYVNYGFLPQGQSASTKENIRRLANFILTQNKSIFVDPGTDYFVNAGQPPVRFFSMSQFTEYDSRYS